MIKLTLVAWICYFIIDLVNFAKDNDDKPFVESDNYARYAHRYGSEEE